MEYTLLNYRETKNKKNEPLHVYELGRIKYVNGNPVDLKKCTFFTSENVGCSTYDIGSIVQIDVNIQNGKNFQYRVNLNKIETI